MFVRKCSKKIFTSCLGVFLLVCRAAKYGQTHIGIILREIAICFSVCVDDSFLCQKFFTEY